MKAGHILFTLFLSCILIVSLGISIDKIQASTSSNFQEPKSWQTHDGDGDSNWNVNKVPESEQIPVTSIWNENKHEQGYTHHLITDNHFDGHHPRLKSFKTELTNDEFVNFRPQAHYQITVKPFMTINRRTQLNKYLINCTNVRLFNLKSVPNAFKNKKFRINQLSPQQTEIYENNVGAKIPSLKQARKFIHKHKMDAPDWVSNMTDEGRLNSHFKQSPSQIMETYYLCNKSKHFYWHNKLYRTFFNLKFKILKNAQATDGVRYYYIESDTNPRIEGWIPFYALSENYNWFWKQCINKGISTEYQFANSKKFRQKFLTDYQIENRHNDFTPDPYIPPSGSPRDSEGDVIGDGNIPLELVIINLNFNDSRKEAKIRNSDYYFYKTYYRKYNKRLYKEYKREILKKSQEIYLKTPKKNRKYLLFDKYPTNYRTLSKGIYKSADNLNQLAIDETDLGYNYPGPGLLNDNDIDDLKHDLYKYNMLKHSKNAREKLIKARGDIIGDIADLKHDYNSMRQDIKTVQGAERKLHLIDYNYMTKTKKYMIAVKNTLNSLHK